jgi:CRISPR-associated protein Cas1
LRRNSRTAHAETIDQLRDLAVSAASTPGYPTLLGLEGTAARLYFQRFTGMLNPNEGLNVDEFDRNGRARRPPPDPVNALLSFVYALLVKDLTVTLTLVGFDPYVGVFHRPRYGRPALALDLAEEFRPLVADSTVVQVINNREVRASHFTRRAGGCQLDAAAVEPSSLPTNVEWRRRSSTPSSATASPTVAPSTSKRVCSPRT